MTDDSSDRESRKRLLHDAIDQLTRHRIEATLGLGSDRHLLGLSCAAKELGMDLPAVFTDKVCHATDSSASLNVALCMGGAVMVHTHGVHVPPLFLSGPLGI